VAAHDLTPFGFAQGQDAPRPPWFLRRENRDIDLDLGPVGGVVHDTGADFSGRRSKESSAGVKGEASAEGFEMRPDDTAEEISSLVSPDRPCQPRLQPEPFWSHDRLIEGDQRLGDPVGRSSRPEQVGFPDDERTIFQDVERMGDLR
jgi:hypothetical protein